MAADAFFVNKTPFLMILSMNVKFGMAEPIANQKKETLFNGADKVMNSCNE